MPETAQKKNPVAVLEASLKILNSEANFTGISKDEYEKVLGLIGDVHDSLAEIERHAVNAVNQNEIFAFSDVLL